SETQEKMKWTGGQPAEGGAGEGMISWKDIQGRGGGGIYKGARTLLWGWSLPARAKLLPPIIL
ncbi:hypothetical protein, partial [Helicobacter marmotae]|uniref:hypothetical protein n=1 Tax=Helicobacter marmotae TaxID=152490 RepID=UPI001B865183